MREFLKLIAVITSGLIGAGIPIGLAVWIWSICMAAVPAGVNALLIKVIISIALFAVGAGLTIWLAFVFGLLGVMLAAAILDV